MSVKQEQGWNVKQEQDPAYDWRNAQADPSMDPYIQQAFEEDPEFAAKVAAYRKSKGVDGPGETVTADHWGPVRDVACYSGDVEMVEFDTPSREPTPLMDPESPTMWDLAEPTARLYEEIKSAHRDAERRSRKEERGTIVKEEHGSGVKKEEEDIEELALPPAEFVRRYHEARARDYPVMKKILFKADTREGLNREDRETLRVFRAVAESRWPRRIYERDSPSPVPSTDGSDDDATKREHY
ncbi:hypothetical protein PsYK624_042030 [Phanerochaete sordida]|uniref:Uncharacterized protein n=1 Tax=Phanerochaete sordida TaxID=48140 RepID=A0A9P3LAF2_9APHY|nr:hypothetical protein PsYK624_042030 [Phanerochaete sordida]